MAVPDSPPRPLDEWLQMLEARQLPLDAGVRAEVLELLAGGAGAAALAPVMLADPALILLIFREANEALARYDREAHTLDHAISLLGAGRLQMLIEAAPVLAADHPQAGEYRLKLLRSRHAAAQARLWAEGTGLWPGDEVFWATLLAAAPLWLLRLEAGDALHRIDLYRAEHGAIGKRKVREFFGCDTYAVAAALAARWRLPTLSRLSWQRSAIGSLRQWIALEHAARPDEAPALPTRALTELCHQPALVVALANALATEADWDWYSRRCRRLLCIAASACRRPVSTLVAYVHQTAAGVSRDYAGTHAALDLPTPGAKLLGRWQQAHCWFPPASAPAAAAPAAPAVAPADRVLAGCIQRLRQPAFAGGVREVLELGMKALHEGVGLRRVAMLFVKPTRELQTVLSAGAEQAPALRQFRFAAQNNQLLTQLLAKPICLLLDAGNRAKYLPHLPDALKAAAGTDNFALMTVFGAGERPVALVYADNAPGELTAGSRQHTLFRQLCQQLSQTVSRLR